MKKYITLTILMGLLISTQAGAMAVIDKEVVEEKFQDFEEIIFDQDAEATEVELAETVRVEFNLPSVSLLPDSKLYFLKTWWEKIKQFFTWDEEKEIDFFLDRSDKRLAEAEALLDKGADADEVFGTINQYQVYAGSAIDLFNKFDQTTGAFGTVLNKMMERMIGQQQFIEDLKEKLPEDYDSKIDQAGTKIQEFIDNNQD